MTREQAEAAFPRIPGVTFPDVLNELRLRDHSVEPPIATHTGWAVRIPGYAAGDLFTIQGSCVPFAETAAERENSGDPRLSFEERLLLREDADRFRVEIRESRDVLAML